MTAALEGSDWSAARPGRTLPPGKTRYRFYRKLGGPQGRFGREEHFVPTGIRSRTVQPVAQSLYWLSYRAHVEDHYWNKLREKSASLWSLLRKLNCNLTKGCTKLHLHGPSVCTRIHRLHSWSWWPRGLRGGSATARFLWLWVRTPPGAWMSALVCVVSCQIEVSVTGWSLVQRSPTECGVSNWMWSWSLDNEANLAH